MRPRPCCDRAPAAARLPRRRAGNMLGSHARARGDRGSRSCRSPSLAVAACCSRRGVPRRHRRDVVQRPSLPMRSSCSPAARCATRTARANVALGGRWRPKDLRLLFRDRVATRSSSRSRRSSSSRVAGFSLASLYGVERARHNALRAADRRRGRRELAQEIARALADEPGVRCAAGRTREAERLVRPTAGSALVDPAGTSRALAAGAPAHVLVSTPTR